MKSQSYILQELLIGGFLLPALFINLVWLSIVSYLKDCMLRYFDKFSFVVDVVGYVIIAFIIISVSRLAGRNRWWEWRWEWNRLGLKPLGKPYQSGPMEGQLDHAMLSSGPPKDDLGHVIHSIVVVELTSLKSFGLKGLSRELRSLKIS